MKHVQAEQHRNIQLEAGIGELDMYVESTPQVFPGENMICHRGVESAGTRNRLTCLQRAIGDRIVTRSIERGQLLHDQRLALLEVDPQFLSALRSELENAVHAAGGNVRFPALRWCS